VLNLGAVVTENDRLLSLALSSEEALASYVVFLLFVAFLTSEAL